MRMHRLRPNEDPFPGSNDKCWLWTIRQHLNGFQPGRYPEQVGIVSAYLSDGKRLLFIIGFQIGKRVLIPLVCERHPNNQQQEYWQTERSF